MIEYMKGFFLLITLPAAGLLSGCATGDQMVLDPVGPPPAQLVAGSTSATGTLLVYSATRRNADFDARDSRTSEYSDYKILSAGGTLLERVRNNSGSVLQDPAPVTLPPGKYTVVARANGYGLVAVPVKLSAGQTTVLHLEGSDPWPDKSAFNQTNAVCLPDGQTVGWKTSL